MTANRKILNAVSRMHDAVMDGPAFQQAVLDVLSAEADRRAAKEAKANGSK